MSTPRHKEQPASSVAPQASRLVSEADLEHSLAELRARIPNELVGLFGPTSKLWQINRHAALFLGGGRAALLQLAHPYVAQGIADHSKTQSDPFGRFRRTFYNVFAMVYGDLDSAYGSARRVHRAHRQIHGRFQEAIGPYPAGAAYNANEQQALLWVHATLWETSILMFEKVVRPLQEVEKEEYYRETRKFASLFGIDPGLLPDGWSSFQRYNREMWSSEQLAVGSAARNIGSFLFEPRWQMPWPVARWLQTMTAGLMPEELRDAFALPWSEHHRRRFERSLRWLRRSHRLWPKRVRFVPPYLSALRRLDGRTARDPIGEWMTRLYIGK